MRFLPEGDDIRTYTRTYVCLQGIFITPLHLLSPTIPNSIIIIYVNRIKFDLPNLFIQHLFVKKLRRIDDKSPYVALHPVPIQMTHSLCVLHLGDTQTCVL